MQRDAHAHTSGSTKVGIRWLLEERGASSQAAQPERLSMPEPPASSLEAAARVWYYPDEGRSRNHQT
eukprot:4346949-Amphidinium_carterae.1